MLNAFLFVGLRLLGPLAVQSPTVEVEFDRDRDFTEYETYAWSRSQVPADSTADHVRITKAIADKLEEIGLSPETSEPDVRILQAGEREEEAACGRNPEEIPVGPDRRRDDRAPRRSQGDASDRRNVRRENRCSRLARSVQPSKAVSRHGREEHPSDGRTIVEEVSDHVEVKLDIGYLVFGDVQVLGSARLTRLFPTFQGTPT